MRAEWRKVINGMLDLCDQEDAADIADTLRSLSEGFAALGKRQRSQAAYRAMNVPVAYAWEPVIVKPARKPVVKPGMVYRDWIAEPITLKRGLTGAKPEKICRWAFELCGADAADEFCDLFPGTGAVSRSWDNWRAEIPLELETSP